MFWVVQTQFFRAAILPGFLSYQVEEDLTLDPTFLGESIFCLVGQNDWLGCGHGGLGLAVPALACALSVQSVCVHIAEPWAELQPQSGGWSLLRCLSGLQGVRKPVFTTYVCLWVCECVSVTNGFPYLEQERFTRTSAESPSASTRTACILTGFYSGRWWRGQRAFLLLCSPSVTVQLTDVVFATVPHRSL